MKKIAIIAPLLIVVLVLVSGCAGKPTSTPVATQTPTPITQAPTATSNPVPSLQTLSPTPTPSVTPSPTATPTPSPTASAVTVTPSPVATPTPTPTPTPGASTVTPTPTPTPSVTPSPTATPTPSPTDQPVDPIVGTWSGQSINLTVNSNGTCNGVADNVPFTGTWAPASPGNYTGELSYGTKFNATMVNSTTLSLTESIGGQQLTLTKVS
jgi:cytoskeletal protein RodZ